MAPGSQAEGNLILGRAASGVMLLFACVNVAGLLLGRAVGRSREIGVRAALGATRWRLARQLLIESVVLAAAGGAIGVALAYMGIAALARLGRSDMPRLQMIAVDGEVLSYAMAATIFSALLFGLTPALRLARAGVGENLKEGGRTVAGYPHQRMRRTLAAAEVALAFVLVVSSGLLLRSFVSMITANPGFRPRGVMTASLDLPAPGTTGMQASTSIGGPSNAFKRFLAYERRHSVPTFHGPAMTRTPAFRSLAGGFPRARSPKRGITSSPWLHSSDRHTARLRPGSDCLGCAGCAARGAGKRECRTQVLENA